MTVYQGSRSPDGCKVTADGRPLPLRLDLRNHSPSGFEWGYAGSGPAQLALALLSHVLKDSERALAHYQRFKFVVITALDKDTWQLTDAEIRAVVELIERNKEQAPAAG